ncbi:MAG TPA: ABC transporter substrate-binding protein [Azospirillum sp.]|nr:ABC transporter substrate-binding protein [Azospirillum sp.]
MKAASILWRRLPRAAAVCLLMMSLLPVRAEGAEPPVRIGISAEFGVIGSTSAQAVEMGARIAAEEINAAGGVLGGRMIEVLVRDDRSVPARAIRNIEEFAADPAVVAVMCGKYSPIVVESVPVVQALRIPLLDPWAAADPITEHGGTPDYIFRLSMRDSWAMRAMAEHARARGIGKVGLLLPNTEWGRSSERAFRRLAEAGNAPRIAGAEWYYWGEPSLGTQYQNLLRAGAEMLILVANEREGVLLVKEMAALPAGQRLPVLSHWGITGGTFFENAGAALGQVDVAVVQTYSFLGADDPVARRVTAAAARLGAPDARRIPSPVGVAHAYDLVHILARAVERAGSADRAAVRDALEEVRDHQGLVKFLSRPFEPGRHEALSPSDVFLARYAPDGAIEKLPQPGR